jgi:hypothetical protein
MIALIFVLMQYMISAKAGLVNFVDGQTNVRVHEQIMAGAPIETGPSGHVELLLNPGSFLRIGEHSKVVLDSVELTNMAVRIVDGAAIIEAAEIDRQSPIRVTTGNLHVLVVSRGTYRFSDGTALVLDGKLRTADGSTTVKKGNLVTSIGGSYTVKGIIGKPGGELDLWSYQRSADLAKANAMAYHERAHGDTYTSGPYYPYWNLYSGQSAWIYSPFLTGFTFIPRGAYRSYYGYSFVPIAAFAGVSTFGTYRGTPGISPHPSHPAAGPASNPRPTVAPGSRAGGGFGGGHQAGSGGGLGRGHGMGGVHMGGARSGGHGGHR